MLDVARSLRCCYGVDFGTWMQQRVKLGEHVRSADDVQTQGETVAAFVHPEGSSLALLVSGCSCARSLLACKHYSTNIGQASSEENRIAHLFMTLLHLYSRFYSLVTHCPCDVIALQTSTGYLIIYDVRKTSTPPVSATEAQLAGGGKGSSRDATDASSTTTTRSAKAAAEAAAAALPPGLYFVQLITRCIVFASDEFGFWYVCWNAYERAVSVGGMI